VDKDDYLLLEQLHSVLLMIFPYCLLVGCLRPPTACWCIPQCRVNNIGVDDCLMCTKGFLE